VWDKQDILGWQDPLPPLWGEYHPHCSEPRPRAAIIVVVVVIVVVIVVVRDVCVVFNGIAIIDSVVTLAIAETNGKHSTTRQTRRHRRTNTKEQYVISI